MNKNFIVAVFCLIISAMAFAQVPQKMSYQAVVRGSDNNLVVNQQISMRVKILRGTPTGTAVYTETHSPTTNENGLVSIEIGTGNTSGNFSSINWATGIYYIKTEIDINGGTNYGITNVSQLLTVPYAMYAQSARNAELLEAKLDSIAAAHAAIIYKVDALLNGFTDERDGNHYNVVKIGDQMWMAENLRYGGNIPFGTTGSYTEPFRFYPNGDSANVAKYGYLYNWRAIMNGESGSTANPSGVRGICPNGWHLPSSAEWTQLTDYLYMNSEYWCDDTTSVAKSLASKTGWQSSSNPCAVGNNPSENNSTGFSVLPASILDGRYDNDYVGFSRETVFWTCSNANDYYSAARYFSYLYSTVSIRYEDTGYGASVRCVCD